MLKIGVLGAGHLGKIHVKLILELPAIFQLVGFFDPNDNHAQETINQFGIKRLTSKVKSSLLISKLVMVII